MLHHADKPGSCRIRLAKSILNIRNERRTLWKDVLKPVAAVAMGGLAQQKLHITFNRWPKCRRRCRRSSSRILEENKPSKQNNKLQIEMLNRRLQTESTAIPEPQRVLATGCWLFAFL